MLDPALGHQFDILNDFDAAAKWKIDKDAVIARRMVVTPSVRRREDV